MHRASGRRPEDLWRAYSYVPLRLAHSSEVGDARLFPGGLLAMAGVPDPDWNWGFVYGPDDPDVAFETIVTVLRGRDLPGYVVTPAHLADQLATTADRLGAKAAGAIPLLLLDCELPTEPGRKDPSSVLVRAIEDPATLLAAHDVICAAFDDTAGYTRTVYRPVLLDLPGLHAFVATDQGALVAYGATIDEGDVVWFFDLGTHPKHRNKGAATALLLEAMRWWRGRGHMTFGLGADPGARHLYESLGFTLAADSRLWEVEQVSP